MDLQTRERKFITQGGNARWSPDGKYIAFINGVDELWLMDIESRQTEKIDNINPLGEIYWQPDVFTIQP